MRYFVSIIMLLVGFVFVWKTDFVVNTVGHFSWAERHLGGAGTFTFYKLLGVGLLLFGMLLITGIAGTAFNSLTGGFLENIGNTPPPTPRSY